VLDAGPFTSGFLTGLREGVEAALIVGIILAYLVRSGNRQHAPKIWAGVAAASAASLALGVAIFVTVGELRTPYEQLFEGTTLLVAASVVTWMLFWMRRQSAGVGRELRAAIDRVLSTGGAVGLAVLAFSAVIREGIESALFLVGQATAASQGTQRGAGSVLAGAALGLVVAAIIGAAFYRGSRRVQLGVFFRWTGILLVFIAAGLLSRAIGEFIEIGVIGVGTGTVYDLSGVLGDQQGLGSFLRSLIGYSAAPQWTTLGVYLVYLVAVLVLYLRPSAPPRPLPAAGSEPAPGA